MTNLEIREVQVRSVDTDKREITGLAVPYGQVTDIGGYKERFEKGAFNKSTDVKLFYGHKEPIGLVTKGEDTDEGYVVTAKISNTTRGDEVYTLMKDGVLNRFSVGFLPVEDRMEDDVVVRTKADLKEVSVVAFPAYEGAKVSEVREDAQINNEKEDINMSETNDKYAPESEVADLRGSVEDLERRFAMIGETSNTTAVPQFRTGAEFVKALASGSKEARDFATMADADVTRTGWVAEGLKLIDEQRVIKNLFSAGRLPASGNSIEYPVVASVAGDVEVQENEGDNLSYMEVALDTATAPVVTLGGYSSLSRQAIERSDLAYLETVLRYQALAYARASEALVVDAITAAVGAGTGFDDESGAGWVGAILTAGQGIRTSGANPDFIVVDSANFLKMSGLVDTTGRPLFDVNGDGSNTFGTVNLGNRGAGRFAGLPVVVDWSNSIGGVLVASSEAVKVFESPGAPYRLQDENIINLTKDFSLYGYQAVAVTNAAGLVRLTGDA